MKNQSSLSLILGTLFLLSTQAQAQYPNQNQFPNLGQSSRNDCYVREDGSSICMNDRVIDYKDDTGFVRDMYAEGTAIVEYDQDTDNNPYNSNSNVIDLQYVSREVECLYGYCAGDQVLDQEGAQATLTEIFENGRAELSYSDGEVWYANLDDVTALEYAPPITVNRPWGVPRAYPGPIYSMGYFSRAPMNYRCDWPMNYPYVRIGYGYKLGYGVNFRILRTVHPIAPRYVGRHSYEGYQIFRSPVRYTPRFVQRVRPTRFIIPGYRSFNPGVRGYNNNNTRGHRNNGSRYIPAPVYRPQIIPMPSHGNNNGRGGNNNGRGGNHGRGGRG